MKYSYWRSIFVPLAGSEYQLFGTQAIVLHHRPYSLLSQHLDLITGEINSTKSLRKCTVTNADSGGRKQIKTKITIAVQTERTVFIVFCFPCRLGSWLLMGIKMQHLIR